MTLPRAIGPTLSFRSLRDGRMRPIFANPCAAPAGRSTSSSTSDRPKKPMISARRGMPL